ncbi:hypothetical protein JKP88DRAFT_202092 [Tribonema minus]|uniref:Ankyrin repeat domain-containing protein n=1 Tax=Tribonema minus TaxID=303371 RepID=A0A835YWG6_9STRA|nr:hypothetical protein JKP88DRAFT_202092 [Tribonema minus]
MDRAAGGGDLGVLQWLRREHALPFTPRTMQYAAEDGHLPALQWLHQAGCPYDIDKLCAFRAASGGHVEVLQWLSQQRKLPFTPQTMTCAAKHRRLSALQWLCQAGCLYDIGDLCSVSLNNAVLELTPMHMEWLRSLRGSWSRKMVTDALFNLGGCPSAQEMVVWLRSKGAEWPRLADVGTLEYNIADAQAVLWAAQQGCPWGHWTPRCCAIVSRGRYSIKKMLHDAGCPGRVTLMDKAAAGGHIEVLQWLHQEHALPFRSVTMSCAAEYGQLAALQWLHQAGCPHDINELCRLSLDDPMMNVTPPQMEWLRGIGGSWSREQVTEALSSLVGYCGTEKRISWLRSEGAEWLPLAHTARRYSDLDCVDSELQVGAVLWAAQQGCPWGDWTPNCCAKVSRGRYSIKKALHNAGCPCQCDCTTRRS